MSQFRCLVASALDLHLGLLGLLSAQAPAVEEEEEVGPSGASRTSSQGPSRPFQTTGCCARRPPVLLVEA